jgi:syntaxin 18
VRTEKTGVFARLLSNPEEDAINVLVSTHRGAITWYLSKKLTEASDIQRNQQEVRLMREVEKSKRYTSRPFDRSLTLFSIVIRNPPKPSLSQTPRMSKQLVEEQQFESTLTQEQLQSLEEENTSLLEGFERTLDQIKYPPRPSRPSSSNIRGTEKALLEISSLQSELMTHLTAQAHLTDQLYDDALETTESVAKGNQQLIRARKRMRSSTKIVLAFLLFMTLVLLLLDAWY